MTETTEIWRSFAGQMRAFIARRVEHPSDVEDILQEVFLRIHERLATLKRADRLVPWLFQITRNCIADYYRSPRRRREAPFEIGSDGDIPQRKNRHILEPAIDTKRACTELSSCLQPMIRKLPHEYREALSLVALDGKTEQAAANQVGLSLSGMKSRVQRGRELLKTMLGKCCHIQLDSKGSIIDYETRSATCQSCSN